MPQHHPLVRVPLALACATVALLAVPAPALADTVVGSDGTRMHVYGQDKSRDAVVVTRSASGVTVSRATGVAPGGKIKLASQQTIGCAAAPDGSSVTCGVTPGNPQNVLDVWVDQGDDYLDTRGLTGMEEIEADLGPGADVFLGDHVAEVEDGPGADVVTGAAAVLQPSDSAGDAGDVLTVGGTGVRGSAWIPEGVPAVVSYWLRRSAVTVTADGVANDGAPGENDNVLLSAGSPHGLSLMGTSQSDDTLIGDDRDNILLTGWGKSRLEGRGGDDRLWALDFGADTLLGGSGDDEIVGGSADDVIDGGAGDDVLSGQGGNDRITGGPGFDTVRRPPAGGFFNGDEAGNDELRLDDGEADQVLGEGCGPGTDTVTADDVLDTIATDAGCETLTIVALQAPVLAWTQAPAADVDVTDATFAWTVDGSSGPRRGAVQSCEIDGVPVACDAAGTALTGLERGRAHTFTVRASKAVGAPMAEMAHTWTIKAAPVAPAPPAPPASPLPATGSPIPSGPLTDKNGLEVLGTFAAGGGKKKTVIRVDRRNRAIFKFRCTRPEGCLPGTYNLRLKIPKARLWVTVKAPALAAGTKRVVRVKLAKRVAELVRKRGKRGQKATYGPTGGRAFVTLKSTRKKR